MIFGRKKPEGKTLLLLDVENGSVGAALLRLHYGEHAPKLFGETREFLPVTPTRDSTSLMRGIHRTTESVLSKVAEVAARVRHNPHTAPVGEVSQALLFLGAPWGRPDLTGAPLFIEPLQEAVQAKVTERFDVPKSLYTVAGALFGAGQRLLPTHEPHVLLLVGGEVSELIYVAGGNVAAYGTTPHGISSVIRTLRTHGGLSLPEAHSLLRLDSTHEVVEEAARHYARELSESIAGIIGHTPGTRVYVVARGGAGEWFARALSASPDIAAVFPHGGVVRALSSRHISPALGAHAANPDLLLGLQALFAEHVLY